MPKLIYALLVFSTTALAQFDAFYLPRDNPNYKPREIRFWGEYMAESLYQTNSIVLTYDDGPGPYTEELLDLLKEYDAKATFFLTMNRLVEDHPQYDRNLTLVHRMLDEGHIISNHDLKHDNSNSLSENDYTENFMTSSQVLLDILVEYQKSHPDYEFNGLYYRFPYGAFGRPSNYHHFNIIKDTSYDLFGHNCIHFVFWDIDTIDWVRNMTSENIVENIYAHLGLREKGWRHIKESGKWVKEEFSPVQRGGGVVLMHDTISKSVKATEILLKEISETNIEIRELTLVDEYTHDYQCSPIDLSF